VQEVVLRVQVQPVPARPVAVKTPPLGRASVTVTVPLVVKEVLLVTVIEYCPVPFGEKVPPCEMLRVQGIDGRIWVWIDAVAFVGPPPETVA